MELEIIRADKKDWEFVFYCLQILLDKKLYEAKEFKTYFEDLIGRSDAPEFWIVKKEKEAAGLITANRFHLPRFLGYGYEFEEIVILPAFQKKGIGRKFISMLIDHYKADPLCRKIVIKSNDHEGSCRLYKAILDPTDFDVFQLYLNKI